MIIFDFFRFKSAVDAAENRKYLTPEPEVFAHFDSIMGQEEYNNPAYIEDIDFNRFTSDDLNSYMERFRKEPYKFIPELDSLAQRLNAAKPYRQKSAGFF